MPTTSNFGWNTPADTDLVKDGAAAIRTLGNNIDASLVDLKGGTTGQILSKASNTDLDYTWINNDQGDITAVTTAATSGLAGGATSGAVALTLNTTAKGGLLVGTGTGTASELAVGSANQVLSVDSSTSTGLKWVTPSTGDLVRITSQSFSAASTINVNDVFSSTYKNYKIFINLAHSTAALNFHYRFRVAGADNTTLNYSYQRLILNATTFNNNRSSGEDKGTLVDVSTVNSNQELTIFNPFATQLSYVYATGAYECSNPAIHFWYNGFNATTSFTGITFYVGSGSVTGSLQVYGIKDA